MQLNFILTVAAVVTTVANASAGANSNIHNEVDRYDDIREFLDEITLSRHLQTTTTTTSSQQTTAATTVLLSSIIDTAIPLFDDTCNVITQDAVVISQDRYAPIFLSRKESDL